MTGTFPLPKQPCHRTLRWTCCVGVLFLLTLAPAAGLTKPAASAQNAPRVRIWTVFYTAHNGARRQAVLILPSWYGPKNNPKIPLVISPHGRGGDGRANAKLWGNLPAIGAFAVINPDGMGRVSKNTSYGYRGQIDDLAKMPQMLKKALPWLRINLSRIYAVGSSMGGQETLLLVARYPHLLAGAIAMDSVTNLSRRYWQLPSLPCNAQCRRSWGGPAGIVLQRLMYREVGGTPQKNPSAYSARSPLSQARAIALSGVHLQLWWSYNDRIVVDQRHQSETLFNKILRINPCAPVSGYSGHWPHSFDMRSDSYLRFALADIGLLPSQGSLNPKKVQSRSSPSSSCRHK